MERIIPFGRDYAQSEPFSVDEGQTIRFWIVREDYTTTPGESEVELQVKSAVGTTGRQFTVATAGSNFDTMISVWSGTCSNLINVACTNAVAGNGGERLSFTTDGTNTFYIVAEGSSGGYGKLKLKVTSP